MRFWLMFFIFSILLLSACSVPVQEIPVGVDTSDMETPLAEQTAMENPEPIVAAKKEKAGEQVPLPTGNSSLSERVREARYSAVIDLTQLTEYNCEQKLDELEEMLAEALHDEEGVKEDIADQQHRVATAEQAYEDAKESSDKRDLIQATDDLEQEQDALQDLKNERYNLYRRVIEIKETLDRAEPRCMAMVKDRYK